MVTQEKEQTKFDKNLFVSGILDSYNVRGRLLESAEELINLCQGGNYRNDHVIKDEQEVNFLASFADAESSKETVKTMFYIYKNPQSQVAKDFVVFWNFIRPAFWEKSDDFGIMNVVNKINIFNEDLQLKILKNIIQFNKKIQNNDLLKKIHVLIANNPKSRPADKAMAAKFLRDVNIIRDTIEDLKQDLQRELNKEMPDTDVLKKISYTAMDLTDTYRNIISNGTSIMRADSPEGIYYFSIRDEFDLQKIMTGGAEYVPQITQSLEERLAISEKQLKEKDEEVKKLKQYTEHLNSSISEGESKLDSEKTKNEQLVKTINEMQVQLESKDNFIKSLKMKVGAVKTGLFGGGAIKDLQEWIKQSSQNEK